MVSLAKGNLEIGDTACLLFNEGSFGGDSRVENP